MNSSQTDLNWNYLEKRLQQSKRRVKHAVLRFYMDYPNSTLPTFVPSYLIAGGLKFNSYSRWGGGLSPDYSDSNLLAAITAFVAAFGRQYDGDPRIGFIQVGFLGFWGEWHTSPCSRTWIPDATYDLLVNAFDAAFQKTQLAVRYPDKGHAMGRPGFGLHDDSFAFSTLDGPYNGGVGMPGTHYFFWERVLAANASGFWRHGSMGGEVYPDLWSSIFSSNYPANKAGHQNLSDCIIVTHATSMLLQDAFRKPGYIGTDLERARNASLLMGYRFVVPSVTVSTTTDGNVTIAAAVANEGVAPFYYPLSLSLACGGTTWTHAGVDALQPATTAVFTFKVLANAACLSNLTISLSSNFVYDANPVRFAQGNSAMLRFSVP